MPQPILTVRVPSSDPRKVFTTYAVTVLDDGTASCECKGYRFHGRCRHVVAMLASLRGEGPIVGPMPRP